MAVAETLALHLLLLDCLFFVLDNAVIYLLLLVRQNEEIVSYSHLLESRVNREDLGGYINIFVVPTLVPTLVCYPRSLRLHRSLL